MSLLVRRSQRAVMLLLGLWMSGQSTLSWALSVSDVVNNTVVDLTMIDGCGDKIRGYQTADKTNNRCWREGIQEPYPDTSSEICAYDNQNDKLELAFDEVQVNDPDIDSYVVVRTPGGGLISETKVDPLPFDVYTNKRRTTNWPLTGQNGMPLNVGRQGKSYRVQMERRNGDTVLYRSGRMDVFVDDCVKRQQDIMALLTDDTIVHTAGFDLYIKLLSNVTSRICSKIRSGLVERDLNNTFSQRCRTQCINNTFTNLLVDYAKQPSSSDNVLANTHRIVMTRTADAQPRHLWMENMRTPIGSDWFDPRAMLVNYVTMEDELRAEGYLKCAGPLGANDRDMSVVLIRSGIDEILTSLEGFVGEKLLRTIDFHLDRTETIYRGKLR